jgi:hypothetical protein
MDWIEDAENCLIDKETGESLLDSYYYSPGDDEHDEVNTMIGDFLSKNTNPVQDVLDKVLELCKKTIEKTIGTIQHTWIQDTISVESQRECREQTRLMSNKCTLLVAVHMEMLVNPNYTLEKDQVFENINKMLLSVIPFYRKYPHKPGNILATLVHFQIKDFLSGCTHNIWSSILPDSGLRTKVSKSPSVPKLPLDLFVPTLRRLGMMDLLDQNWTMYEAWDEILSQFQSTGILGSSAATATDSILKERSNQWKLARNSIMCRNHHKMGKYGMPNAPQCFRYFPKCTASPCLNIETADKPHKIRCQTCWYFHCCSPGCQRYAEMFDQHQCQFTPPEKASQIRDETKLYLQNTTIVEKEGNSDQCNFCATNKKHLPQKMSRCGACQSVWYCSKDCQQWDWTLGNHKAVCKKK